MNNPNTRDLTNIGLQPDDGGGSAFGTTEESSLNIAFNTEKVKAHKGTFPSCYKARYANIIIIIFEFTAAPSKSLRM